MLNFRASFRPSLRPGFTQVISVAALLLPGAAGSAATPLATTPLHSKKDSPPVVAISVDAGANLHQINPLIYGLNFAPEATLHDLGATINRSGGDASETYNWRLDANNAGSDWYFESLACSPTSINDQFNGHFVSLTYAAGAAPMLTIPMVGRGATLGPDNAPLASFSTAKYGPQQSTDAQWFPDAGNGVATNGAPITGNNPNDATILDDPANQQARVAQLATKFGTGSPHYYILGNEPSLWQNINRDIHPIGAHATEIESKVVAYSAAVRAADPNALIVAPEEWGWNGYFYSGFDQQYANTNGFANAPDRANEESGMEYVPWLLKQWKAAGHPIDVFSLHFYPQGGEYGDTSNPPDTTIELDRNTSTRDLWDPNYVDPTWINSVIDLIPMMRQWADTYYYPGTPIALTEYDWGGDDIMNGATTQADLLGIFGREGLDIANRWTLPTSSEPVYKAFKLYRNYDGNGSAFGETSVSDTVPDTDLVSSFDALRAADGALTLMVINKQLTSAADVTVSVANFAASGTFETWQLASNKISHLADTNYKNATLQTYLQAQSVTLFVLHGAAQ